MKLLKCSELVVFIVISFSINEITSYAANDLTVNLVSPSGKISGHTLQSENGIDYYAFQQIPYAAPPIGDLRYKLPQSHTGWNGVLDCTNNTKMCPQPGPTYLEQDEDCLFVNVYTPLKPGSASRLPVYVWIHGGGYSVWDGGIFRFNPSYLIDYNIVIVTLNYRLGALGFLATDDCVIPGNLGLRDQNFALKWVSKNIHLFGGDYTKVTIGGESVGASSVGNQILSKMSKGLFRAGIQESGSSINYYNYVPSPSVYAYKLAQVLDSSISPTTTSTSALRDFLRQQSVNDIISASTQVRPIKTGGMIVADLVWAPTLENDCIAEPFLSEPMHQAVINGDFNRVPLLTGFTSEEMLFFTPASLTNFIFKVPTLDVFNGLAASLDADIKEIAFEELNILESKREEVSERIKSQYTNSTFLNDTYAYIRISTDLFFVHPFVRQAQLSSKFVPTYMYQFDYTADDHVFAFPGTQHTEELRYLWKNIEDRPYDNDFQPILRNRMCKLWTNFIIHLNPTPEPDQELLNLVWPLVKPCRSNYVNINEQFNLDSNPRRYNQIKKILLQYLQHPWNVY